MYITLFRSPALYECEGGFPPDIPDEVVIGPFERVILTYSLIRVFRPGADMPEDIGCHNSNDDLWYFDGEKYGFSDLTICGRHDV